MKICHDFSNHIIHDISLESLRLFSHAFFLGGGQELAQRGSSPASISALEHVLYEVIIYSKLFQQLASNMPLSTAGS